MAQVDKIMPSNPDVCSQAEPDTQKIECDHLIFSPSHLGDEDSPWGWLHPISGYNFKPLALHEKSYSFGRSLQCDVTISEEQVKDLLSVISKVQFRIFKETLSSGIDVFRLEDLSMNGTFVNKSKVGKGKNIVLNSGDDIALSNPYNKVYMFAVCSLDKDWIPSEMKEMYIVIAPLGKGAFGEVKLAQNKVTDKLVAIKKIKKIEGKEARVYNEGHILSNLNHPCVVTMEKVFETSEALYIVLEYVPGGELSSRIRAVTRLKECEAKCVFYQLLLALQYLHLKGVAHRDLKPENVLLCDKTGENLIKVSDFGLSKLIDSNTQLKSFCGTPSYTAPEILMNHGNSTYTHQVDIWSLGVILFQCLSGTLPFHKGRAAAMPVIEQIVRGSYSMVGPEWRGVSPQAVSLIKRMLRVDPKQRITIEEILQHPWLQDKAMKRKMDLVIKVKSRSRDENLNLDQIRPAKMPRLEEDETLFKS